MGIQWLWERAIEKPRWLLKCCLFLSHLRVLFFHPPQASLTVHSTLAFTWNKKTFPGTPVLNSEISHLLLLQNLISYTNREFSKPCFSRCFLSASFSPHGEKEILLKSAWFLLVSRPLLCLQSYILITACWDKEYLDSVFSPSAWAWNQSW